MVTCAAFLFVDAKVNGVVADILRINCGNIVIAAVCLDNDMRIQFAFVEQFMNKFAYCHSL